MSQLILPARFNKQPQSSFEVDWGNPITRGLVFAYNGAVSSLGVVDVVQQRRAIGVVGSAYPVGTGNGNMRSTKWGNGGSIVVARDTSLEPRSELTHAVLFDWNLSVSPAYYQQIITKTYNNDSSPYVSYAIGINPGSGVNVPFWTIANSSGVNYNTSNKGTTISNFTNVGKPTLAIGTFNGAKDGTSAGSANLYEGTKIIATNGTTSWGTALGYDTSSTGDLIIGGKSSASLDSPFAGNIYLALIWNREISTAERASLTANPWQIFRKSRRLVFVGGSSIDRAIAEALSASDSPTVTVIRFATQTEAATATDSPSQTNSVGRATTETATATDSTSQGQVLTAATTETATATDSTSALRQILAAIDEAASAAQTAAATALTTAASTETATATDAATSAQAGVSSVNETATATDSPQSTGQVTKYATEAVSATDSPASGNQLQAALTEAAAATDAPSARTLLTAAAQEIASATDTLTALLQQVVAVNEAARAQDLITQINSLSSSITEAATATDAPITIQTLALVVSWQFYARQAARFFYAAAPFRAFYAKAPFRSFYALCQSDMAVPIPYAIDPSETKVITLDATADLSGVTLTGTPTIAVAVTKGSDPNASAHFTSPTINTTPINVTTPSGASVTIATGLAVQFIASGCVDGCSYEIRITCQTSQANNVEVLKASLTCTAS